LGGWSNASGIVRVNAVALDCRKVGKKLRKETKVGTHREVQHLSGEEKAADLKEIACHSTFGGKVILLI